MVAEAVPAHMTHLRGDPFGDAAFGQNAAKDREPCGKAHDEKHIGAAQGVQ